MDIELYANTNGKGHWSEARKEVLVTKLKLDSVQEDETGGGATFYIEAYFDRKTWNIDKDGLIYTDERFMRDLRRGLRQMGLSGRIANKVDYTEQGMQGKNFVSIAVYTLRRKDVMALLEFLEADPGQYLAESFVVRKGRRVILDTSDIDNAFVCLSDNLTLRDDGVSQDNFYMAASKSLQLINHFEYKGFSITKV